MKRVTQLYLLCLLVVASSSSLAGETNAVLLRVVNNLAPTWTGLNPAPTVDFSTTEAAGNAVMVLYKTDAAAAATPSAVAVTGTNTPPARVIGPGSDGFVLQIRLQRLGQGNPVTTPGSRQDAQSTTFYNCTPVGGTTNQIFWSLCYGNHADQNLVEQIKENLWQQGVAVRHHANPRLPGGPLAPVNLQVKP